MFIKTSFFLRDILRDGQNVDDREDTIMGLYDKQVESIPTPQLELIGSDFEENHEWYENPQSHLDDMGIHKRPHMGAEHDMSKYSIDDQFCVEKAYSTGSPYVDRGDGWTSLVFSVDGTNDKSAACVTDATYKLALDGSGDIGMKSSNPQDYYDVEGGLHFDLVNGVNPIQRLVPRSQEDYDNWASQQAEGADTSVMHYASEMARERHTLTLPQDDEVLTHTDLKNELEQQQQANIENVVNPTIQALETGNFAISKGDGWYSETYCESTVGGAAATGYSTPEAMNMRVDSIEYKMGDDGVMSMRGSEPSDYVHYRLGGGVEPKNMDDYDAWVADGHENGTYEEYGIDAAVNQRVIEVEDLSDVSPYLLNGMKEHEPEKFDGVDVPQLSENDPVCSGTHDTEYIKPSEYGESHKEHLRSFGYDVDAALGQTNGVAATKEAAIDGTPLNGLNAAAVLGFQNMQQLLGKFDQIFAQEVNGVPSSESQEDEARVQVDVSTVDASKQAQRQQDAGYGL